MAYIYVITNQINGKQYVGKTNCSIEKRFKEHINDSKTVRCEKRPLYSAINKYGAHNFDIHILEECCSDEAAQKEQKWIQKLKTYGSFGYNATKGGDGKKYYNYTELANAYVELKSVKKVCDKFQCDWKTVNVACKENNVSIQKVQDQRKKTVYRFDLNKNLLQTYDSITEAGKWAVDNLNINISANPASIIGKCCNGHKKHKIYGFLWYFDKDLGVAQ